MARRIAHFGEQYLGETAQLDVAPPFSAEQLCRLRLCRSVSSAPPALPPPADAGVVSVSCCRSGVAAPPSSSSALDKPLVEYVEDIYNFYKLTKDDGRVHDYMVSWKQINSKMRAILVDWLIEVHKKFELTPESLYLTINIIDRFISVKTIIRRELQLVGISSMLIACKYEEIWAPEVGNFIAISDNAYVREQVILMEKAILGKLEWYLTVPTPYVFLVQYIKASIPADKEMKNMTFSFAELGLTNYSPIINLFQVKVTHLTKESRSRD